MTHTGESFILGPQSRNVNGTANPVAAPDGPSYGGSTMRSVFVLIERRGEAQQS